MLIYVLVMSFLVGLIGANGIPHFVKGISGQKHMTPFGRPSSATFNVFWGWLNFVIATVLLRFSHWLYFPRLAFLAMLVGALVTGLWLASFWSKHPEYNQ